MSADKKAMPVKGPDWERTATPTRANASATQGDAGSVTPLPSAGYPRNSQTGYSVGLVA